jgi:hypothetical protein
MWWTPLTYGALNEKKPGLRMQPWLFHVVNIIRLLFRIFGSMGKPA